MFLSMMGIIKKRRKNCYCFEIPEILQKHVEPYIDFIRNECIRNDPPLWDPDYDFI